MDVIISKRFPAAAAATLWRAYVFARTQQQPNLSGEATTHYSGEPSTRSTSTARGSRCTKLLLDTTRRRRPCNMHPSCNMHLSCRMHLSCPIRRDSAHECSVSIVPAPTRHLAKTHITPARQRTSDSTPASTQPTPPYTSHRYIPHSCSERQRISRR